MYYTTLAYEANKSEVQRLAQARPLSVRPAPRRRTPRRAVLAAIGAAAAAFALLPAVASAQTQSLYNVTINTLISMPTQTFDMSNASTQVGAYVIEYWANGGANQHWNLSPDANGYDHVVNVNSGLCLATDGVAGDWINQWPCTNNPQEDWSSSLGTSAPGRLENPASGLYMSIDGSHYGWLPGTHILGWYYGRNDTNQTFTYTQN